MKSKNFLVKSIAMAMTITMILGTGITAFAEVNPHAEGCAASGSYVGNLIDHGTHEIKCNDCGNVIDSEAHSFTDYVGGHVKKCDGCRYEYVVQGPGIHTPGSTWEFIVTSEAGHIKRCTRCDGFDMETFAVHNTDGPGGSCDVCGYGLPCGGDDSHEDKPAETPKNEEKEETSKEPEIVSPSETVTKDIEATVAKEEALPVATFTSVEAINAIPAEVKADNTTVTTYNISTITTTQGFVAAVNKVAKASAEAPSVAVYSSKPIAMNATVLDAVAKTGKTFTYTFTYKGHIYKVTIPAGTKVNTNGQMFMGPLAIGAQLGTTEIIK